MRFSLALSILFLVITQDVWWQRFSRHLYFTFERHWPRAIADTLAEFRVMEATRLLATTHMKQYSVAVQSGFSSEVQMSRAFAKRVGSRLEISGRGNGPHETWRRDY